MSTEIQTALGRFVWHDHLSGDPAAATAFYTQLLGWELESWPAGDVEYPMIKAHEQTHGGFGPAQDAPPHWLGNVCVEDADAAAARAEAAGGRIVAPGTTIPEIGRWALIADRQGAVLSLFAPADDAPTSAGVFAWDELLTTDVDDAKDFYAEVVGWSTRAMDMGPSGVYTLFSSGGVDRAGCMTLPEGAEGPPAWVTYLAADDVDDTVARAESLGATTLVGGFDVPGVGRIAMIADPLGAVVGLYRPNEP